MRSVEPKKAATQPPDNAARVLNNWRQGVDPRGTLVEQYLKSRARVLAALFAGDDPIACLGYVRGKLGFAPQKPAAGSRGAVAICVGIDVGAISSVTRLPDHAARSIA